MRRRARTGRWWGSVRTSRRCAGGSGWRFRRCEGVSEIRAVLLLDPPVLTGRGAFCATVRFGGVLAGDFFWIFRGFTGCAGEVRFAQHPGCGGEGVLIWCDGSGPAGWAAMAWAFGGVINAVARGWVSVAGRFLRGLFQMQRMGRAVRFSRENGR